LNKVFEIFNVSSSLSVDVLSQFYNPNVLLFESRLL